MVAEDFSEVFVQGVDPYFLDGTGLAVLLFQFASALSLSEPDPVGGLVRGCGKARDLDEGLEQHRCIPVAEAPIGQQGFDNGRQDSRGQPEGLHPG